MKCIVCEVECKVSKVLCNDCAAKALHILPADPQERVHIYRLLAQSENPLTRICAAELMKDDVAVLEERLTDPTDRYFHEREA